ncbi:uncharacterized protein LOC143209280 [Lasioglossum baleicum]|uniref:uncharacterized protein LOC143209280 n=1 Tax=Lasioglossum baleicum TaxID=434251 RepID=UPI003FCCA49B
MIQIQTGHGIFVNYLFKRRKCARDRCWFDCDAVDTPKHSLLECPRWQDERGKFCKEFKISKPYSIKEISEALHTNDSAWKALQKLCTVIMKDKQLTENLRQKEERRRKRAEENMTATSSLQDRNPPTSNTQPKPKTRRK